MTSPTTTTTTLLSLADRCEKLTGPCRETDGLIAMAIGLKDENYWSWQSSRSKGSLLKPEINFWKQRAPTYTASLDAAMTLVPEAFVWTVSKLGNGKFWASIAHPDGDGGFPVENPTVTPAGALTSSSLRARSALEASRG